MIIRAKRLYVILLPPTFPAKAPERENTVSQDVTECPRCTRRTPVARGECIYCGESLPFFRITSAPPQRNIDCSERAFNTVLEPSFSRANEGVFAALASALEIERSLAEAIVTAGKPVPLARSHTRAEAEMITALVRTCGLRAVVIDDAEFQLARELVRAKRLNLDSGNITFRHSGGNTTVSKDQIRLLVIGELQSTSIDYTEAIGGVRAKSGNLLDSAEYRSGETLLDIYSTRLENSFRVQSDAFDYSGLISPLSFRAELNFKSALTALRGALPRAQFDEDFLKMRVLLERAWPGRSKNESRGIKRTGLGFRAVAHASVISSSRDQFDRYSRLMFLASAAQIAEPVS